MGIETAAALAAAASASAGTAAAGTAAAGAAAAAGTAAAAGAGTAAAAGASALTAAEAGAAAAAIAEGAGAAAGAAGAAGGASGVAAGSLEAANLVGAIGGDSLGAFISANQGFGTMSTMESIAGMGAAIGESPLFSGAGTAASGGGQTENTTVVKTAAPPAGEVNRPNQNPSLTQSTMNTNKDVTEDASSLNPLGFANGGQVPQNRLQEMAPNNIFAQTRERREQEAGLSTPNITINVGTGGDKQTQAQPQPQPQQADESTILGLIRNALGYQDGGVVRTGSSDVKAGGVIRGPESHTGQDNQIIKVAGGEGILPKDVMDVPGVADLVQGLIQTYHKPI